MQEAHRRVMALHGLAAPARGAEPPPTPAKTNVERKPDLSALPKNLAQVPGSSGPGDVSGEFSDVMSLDGFDMEDAIARMTPAQRARFVKAA